ncbi:retrovirus-related Pol polyprotein from transposon TNT 1-94, partial [Dorcoceras hygrometricum]
LWHARLGHVSLSRMNKLVRSDLFDLSDINSLPTCESCLKGKITKHPFKGKGERAQDLLDLIHTDVCGLFSIGTKYGHTYFITFTDDYSRYGYLYLMKYKSESFERFKEFKAKVENQLGKSIKALRSDRGGEYLSAEFQDYLRENGILSQWTPPATPQLNGVAERRNRTFFDMVRSMMSFTELPTSFWGYALETAVMLLNNVHTKAVDKTPYEIWMGKPPKYSFMRIWGCPAYVKQTVGDKLDTRSILCYFIGYPKNSIGYYFYYPSETKVFVSRNATFMERELLLDRKGRIVELEEVREPTEVPSESPAPTEPVPDMVAPRRSERIPRAPERYGFLLEDDQGITDSACKNQLFMVSVQYGPFNTYVPIRSTTIGKSRVARDPITMHTSWRLIVTSRVLLDSIGYPRMKASDESSATKHRLLHGSGPHPIPPPNDWVRSYHAESQ